MNSRFLNPKRFATGCLSRIFGTVTHVSTQTNVIALTFDDGPHPKFTPELLDTLEQYNAHATFFMVGQAAVKYPELVREVYNAGHAIGNHTYNHVFISRLSYKDRIREVRKCQSALQPYCEKIFRPPWGGQTVSSRLIVSLLGYRVITWNLSAKDWLDHSARTIAESIAEALRPGCIVLLHDRIYKSTMKSPQYDRSATVEAVRLVLEQEGGKFRFVTVPQLLKYGKPHFASWIRKE